MSTFTTSRMAMPETRKRYKSNLGVIRQKNVIECESYVQLKTKQWLKWQKKYYMLSGNTLTMCLDQYEAKYSKTLTTTQVIEGGIWTGKTNGIKIDTIEHGILYAYVNTRAEWAIWLNAFTKVENMRQGNDPVLTKEALSQMQSNQYEPSSTSLSSFSSEDSDIISRSSSRKKRVSFHSDVSVRVIPPLSPDEVSELFYTESEISKFNKKSTNGFASLFKGKASK